MRWRREVGRFLSDRLLERPIGDSWLRRMRWELSRFPSLMRRLGEVPPRAVAEIVPSHVEALRRGMRWETPTFAIHFAALRQFLRWGKNSIADQRRLWVLPSGPSSHRRWLTGPQFARLYQSAQGRGKVLVALEGLNGLRRIEVLRLRAKDVLLAEGCLRVLGKGRDGGKWRKIPLHRDVAGLLPSQLVGRRDEDRLFPLSASGADLLLQRAAADAGFPSLGIRVSHHDLRRTFGRLAHRSGMDLIQLKNVLGHASVEMTVHYIGLDAEEMRRGLDHLVLPEGASDLPGPPTSGGEGPTPTDPSLRPAAPSDPRKGTSITPRSERRPGRSPRSRSVAL